MRTIFTLVRKHWEDSWKVIKTPQNSRKEHRQFFKKLRMAGEHPEYAEVVMAAPLRTFKLKKCADKPYRSIAARVAAVPLKPVAKPLAKKPTKKSSIAERLLATMATI